MGDRELSSYVVPILRRETFLFLPRHIGYTVFIDSSYWIKQIPSILNFIY